MTLSIRARLTLWYCSIVVAVLMTGAAVAWFAQLSVAFERLDDDLARTMATLEGVMRTEFGEGLTLEAAAKEASAEVVVPDRTLVLTRVDGSVLQIWGLSMDPRALPSVRGGIANVTVDGPSGERRVLSRQVEYAGHRYSAAVMAPLGPLRAQHVETARAMSLGVAFALVIAAVGGWLIGRQTLRPLSRMADEARRVNERNPTERLATPPANDELRNLAMSFNGLLDRLASAMNLQRQFMADASHELRTPVSVVQMATQVTLASATRPAHEYRESLEIIGEQAARLSRLVDAMFLLSRAEAHGIPLQLEFLNLDDLVAETVRAGRVLGDRRGVTVVTRGAEEVGLTADDALLRQMVGNLLDNAIRHADVGGQVTAEIERSGNEVVMKITNDGPGIAPADQAKVFQRFVRVGASDGAGLGLPIARWVAEAHSGMLTLEFSGPGRTTFVVTLPRDPEVRSTTVVWRPPAGRISDRAPAR